jgi:hypothetical protein
MTLYGTQEQHEKIPGLYRDISFLSEDLGITRDSGESTPKKYVAIITTNPLTEKILRDRMGL